jgi:hypothetical protein
MHLKKTESTPQHESFRSIRYFSARTAKLNSLLRLKEERVVAQGWAISFSVWLGCLRCCHRVSFHLYGYVLEKEPAKFASSYLLTLTVTASELLSSSFWDSQTEEEIWTPVEAAASLTRRVVLGGIWLDCCEFKDVSSMIVKDIPPMIDEMPKVWFVYGDLVNNNT